MADTPDISGIISRLTEDPEMLGKVMGLASSLAGSIPQDNKPNTASQEQNNEAPLSENNGEQKPGFDPGMLTALLGNLGNFGGSGSSDKKESVSRSGDSRTALLMALKPYMSEDRAEKIDMMLKAMKLADIAGGLLGNSGLFS